MAAFVEVPVHTLPDAYRYEAAVNSRVDVQGGTFLFPALLDESETRHFIAWYVLSCKTTRVSSSSTGGN
jgi:hypothetical protein